jgi:murein DD-endopeptidase MepM/ murein hydrolase activator NlpD
MTAARTSESPAAPIDRARSGRSCVLLAAALVTGLMAGDISAQGSVPVTVSIEPATPAQGSLFTVQVIAPADSDVLYITAEFAGERLHFETVGPGVTRAIAALPIDATGTRQLPLSVARTGRPLEFLTVDVPVGAGDYRMEKLTVAPRFGTPPDSVTQARIRSDQAKAAEVSRRSHDTPRLWGGTLVRPRETRVTSSFGDGREFNGQVQSRHMGLDLAGPSGEPVVAAARGVVALVDEFHLAGNVVYIDHGAGLITAYFHLSRQDVAQGDTVEAGQPIGLVGATGRVTGPHLHWVARYGSVTVDPRSLLALAAIWGSASGMDSENQ